MQVSKFKHVSVDQVITVSTATAKYTGKFKRVISYLDNNKLHFKWIEIERAPGKLQQIPDINILTIS